MSGSYPCRRETPGLGDSRRVFPISSRRIRHTFRLSDELTNIVRNAGRHIFIRKPHRDERNAVRAMVLTIVDETYGDLFAPNPVPIDEQDWSAAWVAVSNTKIIGVILTRNEWISDLWVLPESRSQGVGERLLIKGELEIAGRGHATLRLRVVKSNARAVRFYLHHGWRVAHEFPHKKFLHAMLELIKSARPDIAPVA